MALARRGFDVALAYHRSRQEALNAAGEITALGRRAIALQADLADPARCRALVDEAVRTLGPLRVVVLAASRFDKRPLASVDAAAWQDGIEVDLSASFHCAHAAVPHLRDAGGGHIVLFSDWVSGSGRPRYRGYVPYYVAKRAVIALGEALAVETASDGIRVHVVAPGPIVPPEGTTEQEQRAVMAATPLGRWGGEEEVAERVAALTETAFVTGETVRVDGGRHLR